MEENATTCICTSPGVPWNSAWAAAFTASSIWFSSVLSMLPLKSSTNTMLMSGALDSATVATSLRATGVSSSTLRLRVPLALSPSLSVTL